MTKSRTTFLRLPKNRSILTKVAIIGIQGIPARYGGFETLVENLVSKNHAQITYTIYCSSKAYEQKLHHYKGATLKYISLSANGMQSVPYDILALFMAAHSHDTILVLGVSGCLVLPLFRLFYPQKKLIINIDGMEHRRGKWNRFAKWFLKISEAMAIRFSDQIIVDNKGIQGYVSDFYMKDSVLIAYGGDHALRHIPKEKEFEILFKYKIKPKQYSLAICRIEPENNCHIILEAFSQMQKESLVFIGNWNNSRYSRELKQRYGKHPNILLIESLYELDTLYAFRKNCKFYLHGHSAGGTNPSLVEAMYLGCPVLAYDCIFNRETTENQAFYFKNENNLICLITDKKDSRELLGNKMEAIAKQRYEWKIIVRSYETLYTKN